MDLVLVVLLVLAVGAVVAVALGRLGGGLTPATEDVAPPLEGDVTRPADLDRARFAVALRGYRMDQVDDVLDQARDLLVAKDEEITRLRRRLAAADAAPTEPVVEEPVPDGPVVEEPVPDGPVVEEPVVEERPLEQPAPVDRRP